MLLPLLAKRVKIGNRGRHLLSRGELQVGIGLESPTLRASNSEPRLSTGEAGAAGYVPATDVGGVGTVVPGGVVIDWLGDTVVDVFTSMGTE